MQTTAGRKVPLLDLRPQKEPLRSEILEVL